MNHSANSPSPSRIAFVQSSWHKEIVDRCRSAFLEEIARHGIATAQVDLFEVNEAFAVVSMAARRELEIPNDRLNVWGGAISLGHPIGASGARIIVTLIAALKDRGAKKGLAGICIGGGEATAMAVELA